MKPMSLIKIGVLFIISSCTIISCSHPNDFKLEKVNHTSDKLECNTIFSDSRKSIIELNEILIQIGTISALDEGNTAIIHDNGQEVMLTAVKSKKSDNKVEEIYAGKDYKLQLNYQIKYIDNGNKYNDPYYEGTCRVWRGKLFAKFEVFGMPNML